MAAQTETVVTKPSGIITVPAMTLPTEDGEPLETSWHRSEINLLIEMIRVHWRGRRDFYAGGNMFIYYSLAQARNRDYRGPDFFVARGVDGSFSREAWVVWEEGGKYPDVIVELLSPSTAREDLTTKKGSDAKIVKPMRMGEEANERMMVSTGVGPSRRFADSPCRSLAD